MSSGEIEPALAEARELIKAGDYDRAIDRLKSTVTAARGNPRDLRDAYLLLIKTYVFLGNDLKFKPQGREASKLNYEKARDLIAECLRVKELRHTRPEPASDFPPEMLALFSEVRGKIFGSFRVVGLDPPRARVLFDSDTLGVAPGDSLPGDVDVPIGSHWVVVRAKGYRYVSNPITISPNATLERSYRLSRKRSPLWFATAGALGLAAATAAIMAGGHTKATGPLPAAPPPPTN